jgi:hypothetical protein
LLEKYLKLNVESGFEENKSHMMTIVQWWHTSRF